MCVCLGKLEGRVDPGRLSQRFRPELVGEVLTRWFVEPRGGTVRGEREGG